MATKPDCHAPSLLIGYFLERGGAMLCIARGCLAREQPTVLPGLPLLRVLEIAVLDLIGQLWGKEGGTRD